jgi:hypothetical protein
MTARQVDRAAERLDGLRQKRRSRLAVSAVAAAAAGVALWASHSSSLAISLGAGIVVMALLAFNDTCRRRELLARLALNPHAYVVPDVKSYGEDLVAPRGRERLAASLDRMLKHAGTPASYCIAERVNKYRGQIEALADSLRAPKTRVEPTSVALCWQLLTRAAESPLYNGNIPADDLGFQVQRIQAGIRHPVADQTYTAAISRTSVSRKALPDGSRNPQSIP